MIVFLFGCGGSASRNQVLRRARDDNFELPLFLRPDDQSIGYVMIMQSP
jgi:hypothetical protein